MVAEIGDQGRCPLGDPPRGTTALRLFSLRTLWSCLTFFVTSENGCAGFTVRSGACESYAPSADFDVVSAAHASAETYIVPANLGPGFIGDIRFNKFWRDTAIVTSFAPYFFGSDGLTSFEVCGIARESHDFLYKRWGTRAKNFDSLRNRRAIIAS